MRTNKLYYTKPSSFWEAALPIGNGRIGAMIHGRTDAETLELNEDTIWSGRPDMNFSPEAKKNLPEARRLIAERKFSEASEFVSQKMGDHNTASYLPAGDLKIVFYYGAASNTKEYRRSLDLINATASVSYLANEILFRREIIASYPDNVVAIHITAAKPGALNFETYFTSVHCGVQSSDKNNFCYYDSHAPAFNNGCGTVQLRDKDGKWGVAFRMGAAVEADGDISSQDGIIKVTNASEAVIYVAIRTNYKDWKTNPEDSGINEKEIVEKDLQNALDKGFEKIYRDHVADYQNLYMRSQLNMPGNENDDLPTDQRLENDCKKEEFSPALAALLYNYGRYLLIACSRPGTQPANLQGIWNNNFTPPWRCNYTTNINTEMNYWPSEVTNLSECAEPLFDFIRDLSEKGSIAAKELYGARGWCAHHNSDLWRFCTLPTGHAMWLFWPMCGGWLCRHLMEHYRYTLDSEFLKKAAPIIRGSAEFMLDFLVERDGVLETSPSTSPENNFIDPVTGESSATASGSLMDMSIIRDVLESVLELDEVLSSSDELSERVKTALPKLRKPSIGPAGQLLEFGEDFEETDIPHRHLSHLYGVYPGAEFTPDKNAECYHAAYASMVRRGDVGTGWAMGWRIAMWTRFMDGEHVCRIIRDFINLVKPGSTYPCPGGVYINLFDAHPPFQIDGNFGFTAAIAEMFVQSHRKTSDGKTLIHLFPAYPKQWRQGRITGLRTQGALTVDLSWENASYDITVSSAKGGTFVFRTPDGVSEKTLHPGEVLKLNGKLFFV